ncbi:hypothetical protein ACHAPA_002406 [Fusarium lateritium]
MPEHGQNYETDRQDCTENGHMNMDMFEAGMEDNSGFHVFNAGPNHYHRTEAFERTGAVDITCTIEKVVHGALSPTGDYATLMIMQWFFQPKNSHRISEATIELLFEAESNQTEIEVKSVSFPGTYSLMKTTQDESTTVGTEATVGVEQVGKLSSTGKWEKTTSATTSDAITLSGGKRLVKNTPPYRIAKWTISENQSQPTGIPASLKIAVLVSRDTEEKFRCKINFDCKTDLKTKVANFFKKIPKNDPIIFQPDPEDRGKRPNANVTYGDEELGSINLDDLSQVTYRTVISDGEKVWK